MATKTLTNRIDFDSTTPSKPKPQVLAQRDNPLQPLLHARLTLSNHADDLDDRRPLHVEIVAVDSREEFKQEFRERYGLDQAGWATFDNCHVVCHVRFVS